MKSQIKGWADDAFSLLTCSWPGARSWIGAAHPVTFARAAGQPPLRSCCRGSSDPDASGVLVAASGRPVTESSTCLDGRTQHHPGAGCLRNRRRWVADLTPRTASGSYEIEARQNETFVRSRATRFAPACVRIPLIPPVYGMDANVAYDEHQPDLIIESSVAGAFSQEFTMRCTCRRLRHRQVTTSAAIAILSARQKAEQLRRRSGSSASTLLDLKTAVQAAGRRRIAGCTGAVLEPAPEGTRRRAPPVASHEAGTACTSGRRNCRADQPRNVPCALCWR